MRRETYVGEWLPEPIITDERPIPNGMPRWPTWCRMPSSPSSSAVPEQRAALLLRDVFEYDYPEIASIVGTSPRTPGSWRRGHVAT